MKFCHFWPRLKKYFKLRLEKPLLPPSGNNPPDAHERSMLLLSQGIVYWQQTLLNWYDNNTVFTDGVSRVYANSLPQKMAKNKIIVYTHTAFLKNFKVVHEQKDKKCLINTNMLNYLRSFENSSIFVVKYQSLTKFPIRWPDSR